MPDSLHKLNNAIAEIHSSLSPRHVIDQSLYWSKTLLQCKSSVLFIPDNSNNGLKAYFHLPNHALRKMKTLSITDRPSLEKWIISAGKPQIVQTGSQKLFLQCTEISFLKPIFNLIAVPLKTKNKIIGVLEVLNQRSQYSFSQKQLHFLEMLSVQIAIALHHAQTHKKQQTFSNEQKRQIGSTTDQLRKANKKLRESDQTKSESISMIAHELRSPITSISGFAKILCSGNLGPLTHDQKDFFNIIQKNTENIDRLISDLLDMTKLELGKLELRFETLSCNELIKEAVFSLQGSIEKNNQRIQIKLPKEKLHVIGDRLRLVQVIINFLSNALKYSPAESPIHIQVRQENTNILFTVDDQGIPLTPEQQNKVFEKFFRIKTGSKKITGSGLGLAIAKIIIDKHDGVIWTETHANGNRFCFQLKAANSPHPHF